MKRILLTIHIFMMPLYGNLEKEILSKDLIEESIEKIDIALLQQAIEAHGPLIIFEKNKYVDMVLDKIDQFKRKIDREELAEKVHYRPHNGYEAVCLLGVFSLPLVILYFMDIAPKQHYKKSLFATCLAYLGLLCIGGKGRDLHKEYIKKRDEDYKNLFKIKYLLMSL